MFQRKAPQNLNDCFLNQQERGGPVVYFFRIHACSAAVLAFIRAYYEAAETYGVVIEGRIPNPGETNLDYYDEIMGAAFQMHPGFFAESLAKWMPGMQKSQREAVAASMYDALDALRKAGKNENMLKNAYVKFMCWLYYRFSGVADGPRGGCTPKILYEGEISRYELMLLSILSSAGCDVVLLSYQGDAARCGIDPSGDGCETFFVPDGEAFPASFSLKWLRENRKEQMKQARLYGPAPQIAGCTNAWISGKGFADVMADVSERGNDPKLFYNCFIRMNGVEDKLTYQSSLQELSTVLKRAGRRLYVAENGMAKPSVEETGAIQRKAYDTKEQMLADLSASNLKQTGNQELQRLMKKAFLDVLLEAAKEPEMRLSRLTNRAVYLLCWLRRCQKALFAGWKMPQVGCFICNGGGISDAQALFLKFLSRLPVDVLILNPGRDASGGITDDALYEIHYGETLSAVAFPAEGVQMQVGTAAFHAERELDTLLYQDSGMYRNQQCVRAVSVTLQTTYEEIGILWNQELKYRPNFSTIEKEATLPVIFAKVCGVEAGRVQPYWSKIQALVTEDVLVIKSAPYIGAADPNPIKAHAAQFLKNGKLLRDKIRAHAAYPYGLLREEMQEHILDKLQLLIDRRLIAGTFENGMEYTIISTVLNLKKEIARLIQKFDFTKKNPKLIFISVTERAFSAEDAILAAFLNLAGFDILFFVPTGYRSVEAYYNQDIMEEHQAGEYLYDLSVPDFGRTSCKTRPSWREKLFKRGN